jgi:hypothetical protein
MQLTTHPPLPPYTQIYIYIYNILVGIYEYIPQKVGKNLISLYITSTTVFQ